MYNGRDVKYPLFSLDFNETWIFSADFSKNTEISNIMKIRPVGAELFHADGQTWRNYGRFPQFCEGAYEQMATWQLE
jgi:hypothetical protein